jgi:hypothetical protein
VKVRPMADDALTTRKKDGVTLIVRMRVGEPF